MKLPSRYHVQLALTIVGASAGLAALLTVLAAARFGRTLSQAIEAFPVAFGIVFAVALLGTWLNNRQS